VSLVHTIVELRTSYQDISIKKHLMFLSDYFLSVMKLFSCSISKNRTLHGAYICIKTVYEKAELIVT
jgi:hypothetical protein